MAWRALTGVCEWWSDEDIRDVGRARFHEERGTEVPSADTPLGTIDCSRVAFAAQRDPWRLAQVHVDGHDSRPAVVAWADEASAVLAGSPPEARVIGPNESHGDLGLRRMLHPKPLETLVPKPWSPQLRIEGSLLEDDMSVLPEFLSLAADFYEVAYDADLEVLTTWTAYVDGAAANRISVTQLTEVRG